MNIDEMQGRRPVAPVESASLPAPSPAASAGGSSRVHVQVDRLQIGGVAPQHQQRFIRALERELNEVAMGSTAGEGGSRRSLHVPHVSVGKLGAGVTPEAAAAQVARRIGQQMQRRDGEANDA